MLIADTKISRFMVHFLWYDFCFLHVYTCSAVVSHTCTWLVYKYSEFLCFSNFHTVHNRMGDVTITDSSIGAFVAPGGNIGTATSVAPSYPPSSNEGMLVWTILHYI